jgi:hypothetical protein
MRRAQDPTDGGPPRSSAVAALLYEWARTILLASAPLPEGGEGGRLAAAWRPIVDDGGSRRVPPLLAPGASEGEAGREQADERLVRRLRPVPIGEAGREGYGMIIGDGPWGGHGAAAAGWLCARVPPVSASSVC